MTTQLGRKDARAYDSSPISLPRKVELGTRCTVKLFVSLASFEFFWLTRLAKYLTSGDLKSGGNMYFQLKTVSSIAEVLTLGHLNAFSLHYFEPKGDGYEACTSEVTIKFLDTVCYVISLLHLIDLLVQFFSQTIL